MSSWYLPQVPFQAVLAERSHLAVLPHSTYFLWSLYVLHELHQCLHPRGEQTKHTEHLVWLPINSCQNLIHRFLHVYRDFYIKQSNKLFHYHYKWVRCFVGNHFRKFLSRIQFWPANKLCASPFIRIVDSKQQSKRASQALNIVILFLIHTRMYFLQERMKLQLTNHVILHLTYTMFLH